MTNKRLLPKEVTSVWPEIFENVRLNIVPLNYVQSMKLSFANNRVWHVTFKPSHNFSSSVEDAVVSIIKEYKAQIQSIDFNLDAETIKQAALQFTDQFLKSKNIL